MGLNPSQNTVFVEEATKTLHNYVFYFSTQLRLMISTPLALASPSSCLEGVEGWEWWMGRDDE